MFLVYIAQNINNNKRYIGRTNNFKARKYKHLYCARKGTNLGAFHSAILKHGEDNFVWNILVDNLSYEESIIEEIRFIKELKPEYNRTSGGEGESGFKFSLESKKKMSDAKIGFTHSIEAKNKISKNHKFANQANTGAIKVLKSQRLKISSSLKGIKYHNRVCSKQSNKTKEKRLLSRINNKKDNSMLTIVIEGPDNVGKTTLAKALAEEFGLKYTHCSKPKTDNPFQEYMEMIMEIKEPTVFDRFYLGEYVYSNLWRGGCNMSIQDFQALDRCLLSQSKVILIHAQAYLDDIRQRCIDNHEELLQLDQIKTCNILFKEIMNNTLCPTLNYNSSVHSVSDLIERVKQHLGK